MNESRGPVRAERINLNATPVCVCHHLTTDNRIRRPRSILSALSDRLLGREATRSRTAERIAIPFGMALVAAALTAGCRQLPAFDVSDLEQDDAAVIVTTTTTTTTIPPNQGAEAFWVLPEAPALHEPILGLEGANPQAWRGGWVWNPGAAKGVKIVAPGALNGQVCAAYCWGGGWSEHVKLWPDPEEGNRLRWYLKTPRAQLPPELWVRVDTTGGDYILAVPDSQTKMR